MSGNYRRQKGTRAFGEQPGRQSNDRWDKDLETIDEPRMGDSCLLRPVGGVLTVGVHYIAFRSPKDGKMKGYFELCPNWSLDDQDEIDRNCPVCQYFHPFLRLKDDKYSYLKMGLKYRYLFHAFNITNIKNRTKPIFGVVQTHRLGMEQIEKAFKIKGYGPDHPKRGYGLHWLVEPAKQKRFNKDISFTPGDNIPVQWDEERGVWKIKVGKKVYTGKEQDLLSAIPKPPTSADLNKKLGDLGLFDILHQAVEGGGPARTSGPATSEDDSDWNEDSTDAGEDWEEPEESEETPEDEEWEEPEEELDASDEDEWEDEEESDDEDEVEDEDEEEEWEADEDSDDEDEEESDEDDDDESDEDDDDESDEDDDDEWEDDEDEVEDEDEDEEEEPEPPKKKKSGKKSGKKSSKKTAKSSSKGKKGGGKKTTKKEEPEDEDDDEWDDDWD